MILRKTPLLTLLWLLGSTGPAWPEMTRFDAAYLTGKIAGAKTPLPPGAIAVVQATWMLRTVGGPPGAAKTKRLYARQVSSGGGSEFTIPSFAAGIPQGWQLVPGQDPVVRIYANGYQRLVIDNRGKSKATSPLAQLGGPLGQQWTHEGEVLTLNPLPTTPDALAKELAVWRKDLDAEIEQGIAIERSEAIRRQERLLFLLDEA